MKEQVLINRVVTGLIACMFIPLLQAGSPLWTFTPLTETTVTVPVGSASSVRYLITNESHRTHTLAMTPIPGISQQTTGGNCPNPFILAYHQSCILNLNIWGSALQGRVTSGPVVCQQNNKLTCYQPSQVNSLNITRGSAAEYTVGGTISGLSGTVVLQINGGDDYTTSSSGPYAFSTSLPSGSNYAVTILTQPVNQICTVNNSSGTVGLSNVSNVNVTCSVNSFNVGGTISGLSGTVVLQNNGSDNYSTSSNGAYNFSNSVANGASYNVSVLTQPAGETCTVANGSGTVSGTDVTNVDVSCAANTTTLTTSVSTLALSVNAPGTNAALTGNPRIITITNTGSSVASNVSVSASSPALPSGTSQSTTCGATLAASATCTITITPGSTASSDGTNPCTSGSAPIAGVITVSADNVVTAPATNVVILGYGCIYESGYIYSVDDTTSNTGSIGGKVASLTDQAPSYPNGIIWSSDGSNNTNYTVILGIAETSTTNSPVPTFPAYPIGTPAYTPCDGNSDGSCDTLNIVSFYNFNRVSGGAAPTPLTQYAAGLCKATIDGFSDWYLPSICEEGYDRGNNGTGCGTSGSPTFQNMLSNLVENGNVGGLSGSYYWSSTEYSANPSREGWIQFFGIGNSNQGIFDKAGLIGVRCSRALTP